MSDTCARCGAPLVRQTDRRRERGYSLRCSVGGHSAGSRPRGTKTWLADPTVAVCPREGCFFDRGTCGH